MAGPKEKAFKPRTYGKQELRSLLNSGVMMSPMTSMQKDNYQLASRMQVLKEQWKVEDAAYMKKVTAERIANTPSPSIKDLFDPASWKAAFGRLPKPEPKGRMVGGGVIPRGKYKP